MGHGSATDLIQTLKDVHHNLYYVKNLLQISMDGPNVNWKMLKLVKEDRKSQDPSSPEILELGSCGLLCYAWSQSHRTKFSKLEAWKITKSFPYFLQEISSKTI